MKCKSLMILFVFISNMLFAAAISPPSPGQTPPPPPPQNTNQVAQITNQVDLQPILATQLPDGTFPANVSAKGQDFRRWERIRLETNRFGIKVHTNSWAELGTGMHYRDPNSGQWVQSSPEIVITNNGNFGALAKGTAHQAWFANNVSSSVSVQVRTPDARTLKMRVTGLGYEDFQSGTNVLIAELQDSLGQLLSTNQVIYTNAFTDFRVDIRYTHSASGIEQDIILRERPPLPEQLGLNPLTTRLLLLTEFLDPPTNVVTVQQVRRGWKQAKVDKAIIFGGMTIGQGTAFRLGDQSNRRAGIPVEKRWQVLDNRQFLIEEINFRRLVPFLRQLAPSQARAEPKQGPDDPKSLLAKTASDPSASKDASPASAGKIVGVRSSKLLLPPVKTAKNAKKDSFQIAALSHNDLMLNSSGFVLDADLETATNFTLRGDTTYVVAEGSTINLVGTNGGPTVIEGGTVIKFNSGGRINFMGPVQCLTAPYSPAIFTSADDDSVGEKIPENARTPGGADCALALNTDCELKYLHIRNAHQAIYGGAISFAVSHSQFLFCDIGVESESGNFRTSNTLMYQLQTNFVGSYFQGWVEHLTLDQAQVLLCDGNFEFLGDCGNIGSSTLTLVNSLISGLQTGETLPPDGGWVVAPITKDHVEYVDSTAFQTVAAGFHYLTDGSSLREAGTIAITPSILDDLKKLTTYPPILLSNVTFSAGTNLTPQAPRNTGGPDLGYHYPPLDFLTIGCTNPATTALTVSNGTAIGYFQDTGIWLQNSYGIVSVGTSTTLNRFVDYRTVQEQPISIGAGAGVPIKPNASAISSGNFTFNAFCKLAGDSGPHIISHSSGDCGAYSSLHFQDCTFKNGACQMYADATGAVCLLTNNLFQYTSVFLSGNFGPLVARNNLFWRDDVSFLCSSPVPSPWIIRDNAFDSGTVGDNGSGCAPPHDHNAFINETVIFYTPDANGLVLSSFEYGSGPLGNFYQVSTNLSNSGSANANTVGLFHYTTRTDQAREGTSLVDRGFHYIALDDTGQPMDADGDGIGDYSQDLNGNGIPDPIETALGYNPSQGNNLGNTQPGFEPFIAKPRTNSQLP